MEHVFRRFILLALVGAALSGCGPASARLEPPVEPPPPPPTAEDVARFVTDVKMGRLPPVASWKRDGEPVTAPVFGLDPEVDRGNPPPTEDPSWGVPVDGGTLIVQYNSAPKDQNGIISNDAVVTYLNELTHPALVIQDSVDFSYGRPSEGDPEHIFESDNPGDFAQSWIKEDILVAEDGTMYRGVVTESEGGRSWTVRSLTGPDDDNGGIRSVPKREGDVLRPLSSITVRLRPGTTWEDGVPFTAQDVEFSMKVILSDFVNSDNIKPAFEKVEACVAVDDATVLFTLSAPYFLADDSVLGSTLIIVPVHAYRTAFEAANPGLPFDPGSAEFGRFFNTCTALNEKPLAAGPYRVERFEANRAVHLVRNEKYHGPRPHADRILWKFISDAVATVQALRGGEIDFAARGPTPEQYAVVMQEKEFRDRFVPSLWYTPSFSFIAYNRLHPALGDARVRAALGMLLDRPSYRKNKQYGTSVLVSGDQFVSGPAYDADVAPIAFDPEEAKRLLDEAGWRDRDADGVRDRFGVPLEFEFLITAENKPIEELAALWMEELSRVGVSIKVSRMEWAAYVKRFEDKKFDAITLGWAMSPESDPHQLWHSRWADPTRPSSNTTSFIDPYADGLIEGIQECLDPLRRSRMQKALHRILDADQPYTFLWCRGEIGAYDRRWRGVKLYPRRPGFMLTEWYLPVKSRKER